MTAYYNENDPAAAAWLRELVKDGLIADGVVDERSVVDVRAGDLSGFGQCHFFAGVGGWSYALRVAGWPDERPVWTGSCPCQPFSVAGEGRGAGDERHLWPVFAALIGLRRPAVVFGEQVASALGLTWFAGVRADLEAQGYAAAGFDLGAASVGAPHARQRLWWVADRVADAGGEGPQGRDGPKRLELYGGEDKVRPVGAGGVAGGDPGHADHGGWRDADWLWCRDGQYRPVERGTFPLVAGVSPGLGHGGDPGAPADARATGEARAMRLRGYGNSIVPQVAAEVIGAYMEARR